MLAVSLKKKKEEFFSYKKKTAYEMRRSLVGSKMCIRDRGGPTGRRPRPRGHPPPRRPAVCLLYTSDAADDLTRVDLDARRIIKKKKRRVFFLQEEDGIRDAQESRGLEDVYKRQGRTDWPTSATPRTSTASSTCC